MKYIVTILAVIALSLIGSGFFLESIYSQKFIGFGTAILFFIVFPLFSYYRWKDKDIKDYMINKENLDKMRNQKDL